jgi:hypothetical protein
MGMERRIFKRFPLALNGSLFLCQGRNGNRLTRPLSCRVVDLSRRGAGILTWQIIVDNNHLFFASLGSDQVILHLAIDLENTDEPPLTLAVRPLWFDRILLNEEQQPFQMGVEFFEKIAKEDFRRLKKVVAR